MQPKEFTSNDRVIASAVFVASVLFNGWNLATPSLWRDETATSELAHLGPHAIFVLSKTADAVQAPYYLLMWGWTRIFGESEASLRVPSVLGVAIAVMCLYLLASRYYVSRVAAVACCVAFSALPTVVRYSQEARSYGLGLGLVMVATLILHVALEGDSRHRWRTTYGVVLIALACVSFVSLFYMLVVHAAYAWRRVSLNRAVRVVAPAVILGLGVGLITHRQSRQYAYIPKPRLRELVGFPSQLLGTRSLAVVFALAILVFLVQLFRDRDMSRWWWMLILVAAPVIFWGASQISSLYLARYLLFCTPFFALIAGIATSRLTRIGPALLAGGVVALGWTSQYHVRTEVGHDDNIRAAHAAVASHALPGDGIVLAGGRGGYAYYERRSHPANLVDPLPYSELPDSSKPPPARGCAPEALRGLTRVWEIDLGSTRFATQLCGSDLKLAEHKLFGTVHVRLFIRTDSGG